MSKHLITLQGDACKGADFLHAIEYSIINDSGINQYLGLYASQGRMPYAHMEKVIMNHVVNNNNDQTSQQTDLSQASGLSKELAGHFHKSAVLQFTTEEEVCFGGMNMYHESMEG